MKKVALFFTAGTSDLKFVAEDGDLLELSKDVSGKGNKMAEIKEIHLSIKAAADANQVVLWPFDDVTDEVLLGQLRARNVKKIAFAKINDKSIPDTCVDVKDHENEIELKRLEDGRLLMAADKMMPLWNAIRTQAPQTPEICAIVGFRTLRETRQDEPIMAEQLIFDKLKEHLNPKYHELVIYLNCDETLEDENGNFLAIATDRIETGVRECRAALVKAGVTEPVEPWLAMTGGIPPVKAVLRAAAELHFGRPARILLQHEGREQVSYYRAPQDSMITRRHALELVAKGDFAGAYAVAQPFERQKAEKLWVKPLKLAASYFDGRLDVTEGTPDFLNQLLPKEMPRCLYAAMRTEAALRAGRTPEAVLWTCAFYDAALIDHIGRLDWVEELDDSDQKLLRIKDSMKPPGILLKPLKKGQTDTACLRPNGTDGFRYFTGSRFDGTWISAINDSVAIKQLSKDIDLKYKTDQATPRSIRNSVAHSALSVERMQQVKNIFIGSGLWIKTNDALNFLAAPHIKSVLERLDVSSASSLYERVTTGLTNSLKGN